MGLLDGKVAVITGTGDGQARNAALIFAREGAKIVGCDINAETAAETQRLVREAGGEMESMHPHDLSEEAACHEFVEFAAEAYGGFDILYNNAMEAKMGYAEDFPLEAWDFTIRRVLTMHWLVTKHAIPHFRKRGKGAILFISSQSGLPTGTAWPGQDNYTFCYGVAKAGMIRMMVALAVELSPLNVRVNSITPGGIATPLSTGMFIPDGAPMYKPFVESGLVDRIGRGEDIANAALYLCSDEAEYVTGTNLSVDGGVVASGFLGPPDQELAVANHLPEWLADAEPFWPTSGERADRLEERRWPSGEVPSGIDSES